MNGRNGKTLLLILLSVLVLVLGAVLPGLLADIHEKSYAPGYAAMNSVELQLRSDGSISVKDAISLVANSINTVEVEETMATRTRDEILLLTEDLLQPYLDRNLIIAPDLNIRKQTYSCKPLLVIPDAEAASGALFWEVLILFDEEEPAIRLGIEDQTGTLVALDYNYSKTEFSDTAYFVPDETLEALCEVYLSGLGAEFADITPTGVKTNTEGGALAQHWSFRWEGTFGPAGICFDVWHYGFSIALF